MKHYRYWANFTERWGAGAWHYEDDMIAFERLSDAEDFMRTALHSQFVYVTPVKFCQEGGCDEAHTCHEERRTMDVERETATLDIFHAGYSHEPEFRLTYGPRGGIIRENF